MQPVGLMLLAAGASTRLGQPKQLLPYRGRTLLRHAAEVAAATGCIPLVLVTGALHKELLPEVGSLPFNIAHNVEWAEGMSSSIRTGLSCLEKQAPELGAAVVMVCDQPLLTADVLLRLISQFQVTGQPLVASAYAGVRGVPALFSREVFAELRALRGPMGARDLLRRYAYLPAVEFPGGVIDVDTTAQYAALLAE